MAQGREWDARKGGEWEGDEEMSGYDWRTRKRVYYWNEKKAMWKPWVKGGGHWEEGWHMLRSMKKWADDDLRMDNVRVAKECIPGRWVLKYFSIFISKEEKVKKKRIISTVTVFTCPVTLKCIVYTKLRTKEFNVFYLWSCGIALWMTCLQLSDEFRTTKYVWLCQAMNYFLMHKYSVSKLITAIENDCK